MPVQSDKLIDQIVGNKMLLAVSRIAQSVFVAAILGIFAFEFSQAQTITKIDGRLGTVERSIEPLVNSPTLGDRLGKIETRADLIGKQRDQQNADLASQISEIGKTNIAILQTLATLTQHISDIDRTLTRLDNKP